MLWRRNRIASLFRQERFEVKPLRSRAALRFDSQSESIFAAKESRRRRASARCRARSDARIENDYKGASGRSQARQDQHASKTDAPDPGELRDGRGAARFESAP